MLGNKIKNKTTSKVGESQGKTPEKIRLNLEKKSLD